MVKDVECSQMQPRPQSKVSHIPIKYMFTDCTCSIVYAGIVSHTYVLYVARLGFKDFNSHYIWNIYHQDQSKPKATKQTYLSIISIKR